MWHEVVGIVLEDGVDRGGSIPTVGYVVDEYIEDDEAIARCLADEVVARCAPPITKRSYLDAASGKEMPADTVNPEAAPEQKMTYRRERSIEELQAAATRARRQSKQIQIDLGRCDQSILGRDKVRLLRRRLEELRDEVCAMEFAARNPTIVRLPIPRTFADLLARIEVRGKNHSIDLHNLPVFEAKQALDAVLAAACGNTRLTVIAGRGVHSTGGPKLAPAIRAHLRKHDGPFAEPETGVFRLRSS
ncbi:hypothetical protein CTAYLR_009959 [Chrysophaeum taylorii]|uniref:Smr domain-containing protein n=1 Tax=Chrysophaeum taylorii TaxID=2483200 RepID=A0AAD7U812_9STRA|nr:hypothetical protein CTAYLR_009959 [Chrysophaeum taylorii]